LTVTFDDEAIKSFNTDPNHRKKLTISKAVTTSDGSVKQVAWLSIIPLPTVKVTWKEEYGFYLSDADDLKDGTHIFRQSISENVNPIQPNTAYKFTTSNVWEAGATAAADGGYALKYEGDVGNQPNTATVGLTQKATIGNKVFDSEICAIDAPYNFNVVFKPTTTLKVMMSATVQQSSVQMLAFSNAVEVDFDQQNLKRTLAYTAKSGVFTPQQ